MTAHFTLVQDHNSTLYLGACQGIDKLFMFFVQTKDFGVRGFHISLQPAQFM